MQKRYYVYILRCSDGSYYTGVTNNLRRRYQEHMAGLMPGCHTQDKRPVKLLFFEEYDDIFVAITREKQIQKWTKKKKLALIQGRFTDLVHLSRNSMVRQAHHDKSTQSQLPTTTPE